MCDVCEERCNLPPWIFFRTNSTELGIIPHGIKEGGAWVKPSPFTTAVRLVHDSIEELIRHDATNRHVIRRRRSETRPFLTPGATVRLVAAAKTEPTTTQVWTTAAVLGGDVEDSGEKYDEDWECFHGGLYDWISGILEVDL